MHVFVLRILRFEEGRRVFRGRSTYFWERLTAAGVMVVCFWSYVDEADYYLHVFQV